MIIRLEELSDADSIRKVVAEASAQAHHSSGTESSIVDKLRQKGVLTLSLVAVEGTEIVGHVAVSPVVFREAPGTWLGLGQSPFSRVGKAGGLEVR